MGGTLDFIQFHLSVSFVHKNIHAAEQSVHGKGCFADYCCLFLQQFIGDTDHVLQITVRHFRIVTEQTHGQIPDLVSGFQDRFIHNTLIKFFRHVFLHPQHLGTLHTGTVT